MICSGDAGVYGMSGLMLEIGSRYPEIPVEIVAGVTAAIGGAAVLGAPLIHDFALISLSDLLTPWEKIEKRLLCAAEADFVICLYNPSSKKRHDYLQKACDLVMKYQPESIVCGVVENIGREGENASRYVHDGVHRKFPDKDRGRAYGDTEGLSFVKGLFYEGNFNLRRDD